MGFVIIGVVLLGLKLAAFGPVALWSWWWVPAPFAAALLWWQLADQLGWTLRAAVRRDKQHHERRRAARAQAMGKRPMQARFGDSQFDINSRTDDASRASGRPDPAPRSGSDRP